ncbi:zinc transporter ZIP13-like [Mercenaria mercenaria]|uniref:zinc transporter ZIP13-like n=1 Tax=Mercenaria mercenaria TaxID=6596 RepID=UPI00234E5AD8|nr:zinc transporter ZIP13-like [Mercenaria mercenaria]
MAIFRYLTFHIFICLIYVTVSNSEIHRAKPNGQKYGVKSSYSQDESYVAETLDILEEDTLSEDTEKRTMYDSKLETWIFSIFGAMLVGLSGIFPLLVIPIEAGPALKHGAAAARLKLLLSFAVGGLLGDVFLHLLPEAWAHLHAVGGGHDAHTRLGLWVITGMLSFLIIEKIFAKEDEFEHLQDECAEAEEHERLHEADYQCQPLHKDLNGSTNFHTDCVANRTRQRTQLSQNQTGSSNSDRKNMRTKQKLDNKTGAKSNDTDSVLNRTNKQTAQNNLPHKSIHKANGAVISKQEDTQPSSIKVSGYLNLAANVIDNFTHGLAVAGGFLVNSKVGCVTLFAILLHEVPHEVGDFAILLRSGFDRWKAAKAQVCTAASGVIGALTALTADSAWDAGASTVWILPFTSGGFIYIALVTVVPDLLEEIHPKESSKQILSLLAGIASMYVVTCVH